ncbi:nucleoside triphosphate pyrophosphohydrolase [Halomarina pelagica]|uniref:nucleoside triphosphate pyrophosphohydrolase n=1 Tax=Halomarina pelagica TaxID=2961599 RepID=UPI0020C1F76C|nr:nucleoside triphosphate pyrophosphohydrolase [Halomarina sp. BND7]
MSRDYDKLVRDRIPSIVEENGERPVTHVADRAEYRRRLHAKLDEEVREFHEDESPEELADVLEVVFALAATLDVDESDLRRLREAKAADRGRFAERIVLDRVEDGSE